MALSDEEKLKKFADEAMSDAEKISEEIKSNTKREFQEKLEDGERKLLSQMNGYVKHETEKIKKETGLAISQAEIKVKQDYFRYIDSVSSQVFENMAEKLGKFMESDDYEAYLFECCGNVIKKTGANIDIFYAPKDEYVMTGKVKERLGKLFDISQTKLKKDETIKTGGLRFFDHERNILINDVFDEKSERAKKLLNSIIGPQFTAIK